LDVSKLSRFCGRSTALGPFRDTPKPVRCQWITGKVVARIEVCCAYGFFRHNFSAVVAESVSVLPQGVYAASVAACFGEAAAGGAFSETNGASSLAMEGFRIAVADRAMAWESLGSRESGRERRRRTGCRRARCIAQAEGSRRGAHQPDA
jgi:hypothetical protein